MALPPLDPYLSKAIDAALEAKNEGLDQAATIAAAQAAASAALGVQSLRGITQEIEAAAILVSQHLLRSSSPSIDETSLLNKRVLASVASQQKQGTARSLLPSGNPSPKADTTMADQNGDEPTIPVDEQLCNELERLSKVGDVNTALVVRVFQEKLSVQPILTLVKQVNERIGIYHNLLEAVKREPFEDPPANPSTAQRLKAKYEGLKLVPPGHLPNPWAHEIADFAMKKLRRYGSLLLELVAQYADDIARELKVKPEMTITFEVGMGLSPEVKIGIERSSSMKNAAGE
jgi:hypothetical protein